MANKNKIYCGIYNQDPDLAASLFLVDDIQKEMDGLLTPYYLWETMAHNYMLEKLGLVPKVSA